ncbi:XAP5, circadian clock regulator-domain-containing protein [Catenaria anguillulae PL171]|uniref:XAP5, circadian clock regulator-domain-containing protein n=1 Tax=Catenaria anguillulae PL171 TaxID=765915 RepID=A0A1Y2HUZ3_9FUNG|nr:XAP5, circadian clock regulator-domain-containing protein [Catenaria anguillulae PL171]
MSTADDAARRALQEKQRHKLLADIARQKHQVAKDAEIRVAADRFVAQNHDVESQLKIDTIGLVHLDEYRSIRDRLELKRKQGDALDGHQTDETDKQQPAKKKKKRKTINTATLSFGDDESAADFIAPATSSSSSSSSASASASSTAATATNATTKPKKAIKDPTVDTSFLPDRQREEEERKERERLRQEWLEQQELIKQEEISIEYSYWDGNGHRQKVTCKKGDTVLQFLDKVQKQWPDLRGVAADNLIFVKEDIILPHHLDFYSLIINKVRGKSGPLFDFKIRDDVRLVNDAKQEIVESHPGKVCQRSWYERNKHIFPASRWEMFDPDKQYAAAGYTFSDRGKRGNKAS